MRHKNAEAMGWHHVNDILPEAATQTVLFVTEENPDIVCCGWRLHDDQWYDTIRGESGNHSSDVLWWRKLPETPPTQ